MVDCTTQRATLLAYVATVLGGGLPVITPVHLVSRLAGGARAAELQATLGAACVVTDRPASVAGLWREPGPAPRLAVFDPVGIPAAAGVPPGLAPTVAPGDPAHLQLTSGSTSSPKAAVVTHANVLANCRALSGLVAMGAEDSVSSWLPLYHDMGLVGMALLSLLQGTDLHLLSPFDFLAHPDDWLGAISTTGAAVTASPTFGFQLAATRTPDARRDQLDLSRLRIAGCGGEPVRADVLAAFAERFAPCGLRSGVIRPCYGLAEATLAVTFNDGGHPPPLVRLTGVVLAPDGKVLLDDCGSLGADRGARGADQVSQTVLVSAGSAVADTE
ncbi:MAG: AMP-binding protein, partial [Actinomycetes bacterium]